ncbi:salivary glue protein Sgs-3-like [Physella acuta]|uniref:salivary glue protein Sgs-3-like n=1 Tax=Physella acuta TaxID=109671 RepID=UPI0027DDD6E6|nr:salivary glue protein Sgs-3-like [Physella acuta]
MLVSECSQQSQTLPGCFGYIYYKGSCELKFVNGVKLDTSNNAPNSAVVLCDKLESTTAETPTTTELTATPSTTTLPTTTEPTTTPPTTTEPTTTLPTTTEPTTTKLTTTAPTTIKPTTTSPTTTKPTTTTVTTTTQDPVKIIIANVIGSVMPACTLIDPNSDCEADFGNIKLATTKDVACNASESLFTCLKNKCDDTQGLKTAIAGARDLCGAANMLKVKEILIVIATLMAFLISDYK